MPISRQEFDEGGVDLAVPVLDLMASRPDLAFTAEDVRELLAQRAWRVAQRAEVEEALDALLSDGQIERKEIRGVGWYTIVEREERRLGFLRE